MLNSIYKVLVHRNLVVIRVINSTRNKLCSVQHNQFSSEAGNLTPTSISETANQDSFTVNYFINTFRFSREKAVAVSRYMKVDSTAKPDVVIASLKKHGFTEEQIFSLVRKFPQVILSDPEKTLLPKIEFFRSLGISDAEVTKVFMKTPGIFKRSLKKQIMPCFEYIRSLFDSNGASLGSVSRLARILHCDLESQLLPNIEILRDAGVPDSKIIILLQYQPRAFIVDSEKFRQVVEEVKEMRFNPSGLKFIVAVHAFRAMNKTTWEKKVAAYKKWGWSENDIISAFERNPYCMTSSADKITAVMDFIVNKAGYDSSFVLKMPEVVLFSLEKRIKPRVLVYKNLSENGLIKKGSLLRSILRLSERDFLKRFVQHYEKEVPELLQLYHKELTVSN